MSLIELINGMLTLNDAVIASFRSPPDALTQTSNTNGMGSNGGGGSGGEKTPPSVYPSTVLLSFTATFILNDILIIDVKVVKAFESALALLGGL